MKKIFSLFFIMILFFVFCVKVNAGTYIVYLHEGKILTKEDEILPYFISSPQKLYIAYLDKDDNLMESFYYYISDFDMARTLGVEVGYDCDTVYSKRTDGDAQGACSMDKYLLYSSGKDFTNVKYWQIVGPVMPNDNSSVIDFCSKYSETQSSNICNNLDEAQYYSMITLKEYSPVSFELICNPKEVKKGESSSCDFVVDATDEVTEIVVPIESDLFKISKYTEADGWMLVNNENGTITLKNESGFIGKEVILNTTLIFKEDLLGDVNINLNDIKYTTLDGYELSGNAKDSVNIYEKIMDEETEKNPDNVDNPDTMDIASIISFLILLTLFIGINNYRIKKELR